MEVDCPLCHHRILIPAAPGGPEEPKAKGKLSMAASTTEHKPQGYAPPPPPKKKRKKIQPAVLAEIIGGIAVVVAGIVWGPKLYDKYKQKQAEKEAAEVAATQPPPPPPEPSAAEIMRSVGDKYRAMKTYVAQGKSTADLDMSELAPNNPAAKTIHLTADTAVRLGRPDLYRLEWALQAGNQTVPGSAWNSGKGNYVNLGGYPAKVRNRETAFSQAASSSGTLGVVLASMFFDDKMNPATATNQFAKTNGASLSTGEDCYILAGDDNNSHLELWVNKKTYLIAQTEVYLNGQLDQAAYKAETNSTIKADELRESKIRGTITETYSGIAVDTPMNPADFEKPASNTAVMVTQPAIEQQQQPGRRRRAAPGQQ